MTNAITGNFSDIVTGLDELQRPYELRAGMALIKGASSTFVALCFISVNPLVAFTYGVVDTMLQPVIRQGMDMIGLDKCLPESETAAKVIKIAITMFLSTIIAVGSLTLLGASSLTITTAIVLDATFVIPCFLLATAE